MTEKAKNKLLVDSFEIEAIWSLDYQSVFQGVSGTLKYSLDRINLKLHGTLDRADNKCSVIYGFSSDGQYISLMDCVRTKEVSSAPGFDISEYDVNRMYIGDFLVNSEDDLFVKETIFSFVNINLWLKYSFVNTRQIREPKRNQIDICIDLDPAHINKDTVILKREGIVISEEAGYATKYGQKLYLDDTINVYIKRFYRLKFVSDITASLNQYKEKMRVFRRLITILTGTPMYYSYIDFECEKTGSANYNNSDGGNAKIRLFYLQTEGIKNAALIKPYSKSLLQKRDLSNYSEIVSRIYEHWDEIDSVTSAFTGDLYMPSYVETMFLNVAKGLEAYYRCFVTSERNSLNNANRENYDEEREAIISFIRNSIPVEKQEYFIGKVNYQDEDTFRTSIKYLIKSLPDDLREKIFGCLNSKKKTELYNSIVNSRNYYTHRNENTSGPNVVKSPTLLYELRHNLNIVLMYYLLLTIGVDPDLSKKRILEFYNL